MNKTDSSPRATGPSGPQFEVKVATHFALALLSKTEVTGLPGAIAKEVSFQRGAQGHPLDDVIVKGETASGETRVLDLQAKRSMAFTKADKNFASVIKAIVETQRDEPDGRERRYAVAIERTTQSIENGVQEVLELARSVENIDTFFTLLKAPGRCNSSMRDFVEAFRKHLNDNGVTDEEELFSILARFFVIHFDFARPVSIAETLDRERASRLTSTKTDKGLYDTLFGHMMRVDSIGGGKTLTGLIDALRDLGVSLVDVPQLSSARARLDEMSVLALSDINENIKGVSAIRTRVNQEIDEALDTATTTGTAVEICGAGGTGKSALLKTQAFRRMEACRILVLSPDRTPQGGWPALRHELEIDAEPVGFFADLACDGGGLVCIDGLDRFRDSREQKTIIDVLRFASSTPGVTVLFTARPGQDEELLSWLPDEIRKTLSTRTTVFIDELDDEEAGALGKAVPDLALLLKPDHPARALTRNLFILRRLADSQSDANKVNSEAQLAQDWWTTGGHGPNTPSGIQRLRRRVLEAVVKSMLDGATLANVSSYNAGAVDDLVSNQIITELGSTDQVKFHHDIYSDWAIGCYLSDDISHIENLDLSETPPYWLSRAFEIACRRIAEGADEKAFIALLDRLSADTIAPGWIGLALLGLARSERSDSLLESYTDTLLHGDGERAAILIRRALATHGQPAAKAFSGLLPEGVTIPDGITLPYGPVWMRLIVWTARRFDKLPAKALAASLDLYEQWMPISLFGEDQITATLLDRITDLLIAHIEDDDRPISASPVGKLPPVRYPVGNDAKKNARIMIALYAQHSPGAVARYLEAIATSQHAAKHVHRLLEFAGNLPAAAPAAFAAAFRKAVEEDVKANEGERQSHRLDPFWRFEGPFVLGQVGIGLFISLLKADEAEGLSLVRDLLRYTEQSIGGDIGGFDLVLFGADRRIAPSWSYGWSRGSGPSHLLSEALAALEHWGHEVIESGRSCDDVIAQILGDGEISGAILLIGVDLALSHCGMLNPVLWDLFSSPETLSLDAGRFHQDIANRQYGGGLYPRIESTIETDRKIKEQLNERLSRQVSLHDAISQLICSVKESKTQSLRDRLDAVVQRVGPWESEEVEWHSPCFMASHALRLASRENYEETSETDADGRQRKVWRFVWPEQQRRWLESQSATDAADTEYYSKALAVRMAMNDDRSEGRATAEMAEEVLSETAGAQPEDAVDEHDPNDPWINRIAAAAFIARHGSEKKLQDSRSDLISIFDKALSPEPDVYRHPHPQIMFDPEALAVTGLLYLASRSGDTVDLRRLLRAINPHRSSATIAFIKHLKATKALGARTIQAAVRIGIESCVYARHSGFDEDIQIYEDREKAVQAMHSDRQEAEEVWLFEKGKEPIWPHPPLHKTRRARYKIRVPGGTPEPALVRRLPEWPDFYFDSQTAAHWVQCLTALEEEASGPVKALVAENKHWLIDANTADEDVDESDLERTWTRAMMECAAERAKAWTAEERRDLVFEILATFSDESFVDAASAFLVKSDIHHIEGAADCTAYLVELRKTLCTRLKETRHWRWHLDSSSSGMEFHLKELMCAFFFRISPGFGMGQSYTGGLRDDQLVPFFPILTEIAISAGPCPTTALLFLDVLETVEAHVAAPFVLDAATNWTSDGDKRFWYDFDVGHRVCAILKSLPIDPKHVEKLSKIADAVTAAGVTDGETLSAVIKGQGG